MSAAPDPRDALLRGLVERVRAGLGGIRAAVETLDAFPDMPAEARAQFQALVGEEARALGRDLDAAAAAADRLARGGPTAAAADVLAAARRALAGRNARALGPAPDLRLAADADALAGVLARLADALAPPGALGLRAAAAGALAAVDAVWDGPPPPAEALARALDAPHADGPARAWLEAHDAAAAAEPDGRGRARLRVLVPSA